MGYTEVSTEVPECSLCGSTDASWYWQEWKNGRGRHVMCRCRSCHKTSTAPKREVFVEEADKNPIHSKASYGYAHRNILIRELGFKTYEEYLQSPLWASIRVRVLKKKGVRCVLCKKWARHIHHRNYTRSVMNGQSIRHLVPLCETCHELEHGIRRAASQTAVK